MSVGNNFIDLRINSTGSAGETDDSVWPAFTDIMTVILMIFLISLVTFLIRNTQLMDELQTTLIAKDQISEQALLSAEQNSSLQSQLALIRRQVLSLEGSLLSTVNDKSLLEETLKERENTAQGLQIEIALLTKLRDQLSDKNSALLSELDISNQIVLQADEKLSNTKNTLNEKISLLLAEKASLTLAQDKNIKVLSKVEQEKLQLTGKIVSLTEQLSIINEALDAQSLELETTTEQNKSLNTQLDDKQILLAGLSTNQQDLQKELAKLTEELVKLQTIYTSRGTRVEDLQTELAQMTEELSKLQDLYTTRGATVEDLQSLVNANDKRFKSLQEEYENLDEEYRSLIRAARSPAGKYVVDVYFAKQAGGVEYRLKTPEQSEPETFSLEVMHQKLADLKSIKKQALYTKIRIDDKSGIGFDEAWRFTQSILSQYDYYHNDYSHSNDLTPSE